MDDGYMQSDGRISILCPIKLYSFYIEKPELLII